MGEPEEGVQEVGALRTAFSPASCLILRQHPWGLALSLPRSTHLTVSASHTLAQWALKCQGNEGCGQDLWRGRVGKGAGWHLPAPGPAKPGGGEGVGSRYGTKDVIA